MNQNDKCELLKDTIEILYTKEGRSKVYISELLKLNRKTLTTKINDWKLEQANPAKRVLPSTQKFINKNKTLILARLNNDIPITKIAQEIGCSRGFLQNTVIPADKELSEAKEASMIRRNDAHNELVKNKIQNSSRIYEFEDIVGEEWKTPVGYSNYKVSNMGRVKSEAKRYKQYYLVKSYPNKNNGRLYVSLINDNGKRKNIALARLVAYCFCDGFSEKNNTVNHKDGDVSNNKAENLEWVSQSDNLKHSYNILNRPVNIGKPLPYVIVYKNKYKFQSIAAFARFLGISWTQASRYVSEPEKHNITKESKNKNII